MFIHLEIHSYKDKLNIKIDRWGKKLQSVASGLE